MKKIYHDILDLIKNNWDTTIILITILCEITLTITSVIDVAKLITILSGLISALIISIIKLYKNREHQTLINLASSFVIGEGTIDNLLGVLISGVNSKKAEEPEKMLFERMYNFCKSADVEKRRRIAEALPALFKISRKESMRIIEILRYDWDDIWRSDNRRRTIEALPLIMKKEREFVSENLVIIDNDEIFTIIAMVEVIYLWNQTINKAQGTRMYQNIRSQMKSKKYKRSDIATIEIEWHMLNTLDVSVASANKVLRTMINEGNDNNQIICAARNILKLCKYYPQCKYSLKCKGNPDDVTMYINEILNGGYHKNIRRPMAKENIVDCLIVMIGRSDFRDIAKKTIVRLIDDADVYISRPTFDKIHRIYEVDSRFASYLVDHILLPSNDTIMRERALEFRRTINQYSLTRCVEKSRQIK